MRTNKKVVLMAILMYAMGSISCYAQNSGEIQTTVGGVETKEKSIKPLRFGAKLGVPTIITANVEYVTPLWNNRVAIMLDYLPLSKTVDEVSINYSNFELGTNIYFNNKGKGFYGGISYASFDAEGTYEDVEFGENGEFNGQGKGDISFNTVNLKLGIKSGRSLYFRMEVGYGFGSIPQEIVVRSRDFPGQTSVEEIPEIPGISDSGLLVFNFGIGFGFL